MQPTDGSLVEQCLKGEREAFARIVERYQHRVFQLALTRMRNRQDADDLAQETFLQAYRKLHSFDQRYSFKTWLFTICANLGKNHLRGLARRREVHHPDMERGLSEEFLLQTVAKGIKVHPNRTKYLLDTVQLLHDAGLKEQELEVFVQNCFEKNLGVEEIDSSVHHIMEKLREGVDGKTICQGLRV